MLYYYCKKCYPLMNMIYNITPLYVLYTIHISDTLTTLINVTCTMFCFFRYSFGILLRKLSNTFRVFLVTARMQQSSFRSTIDYSLRLQTSVIGTKIDIMLLRHCGRWSIKMPTIPLAIVKKCVLIVVRI